MTPLDHLLRDLDGVSGGPPPPRLEHTWNVMVQVLLPLVFVLTFVVISGLMVYKVAYEGLREFIDKDERLAEFESQERLVEAQLERLLRALEVEKAERREELHVSLFPTASRIERSGVKLSDAEFRFLCARSVELFDGGTRSARSRFADEIYSRVLARAKVEDFAALRVRRWAERASGEMDVLETGQTLTGEKEKVVPSNRRRIHNAILDFLDALEEQVVQLQVELLQRVFDDLLATGSFEALDARGARRLEEILDPSTPEHERRRAAEQLYRGLVKGWRERFEEAGYPFLDRTWRAVLG